MEVGKQLIAGRTPVAGELCRLRSIATVRPILLATFRARRLSSMLARFWNGLGPASSSASMGRKT